MILIDERESSSGRYNGAVLDSIDAYPFRLLTRP